jgi:hypothetical protein
MKSRFVFSQTAWDRFKFFVRGPSSLVYQSQAEAIAFRDAFHRNTEMWKLLDQYVNACNSGLGHRDPAVRDEGLHRQISFYEVNIDSDLQDWANSQISILKAAGKGNNKLVFDLLKKIGTRAVTTNDFRSNSREVVKKNRSLPDLSSSPSRNTSQPEKSISKPPSDNSITEFSNTSDSALTQTNKITPKSVIKIKPSVLKQPTNAPSSQPTIAPLNQPGSSVEETNKASKPSDTNTPKKFDTQLNKNVSKPVEKNEPNNSATVYNHKNNTTETSNNFQYLRNLMESDRVDETKNNVDDSDYFNKIRTGNDFLFLAASKVFPEIQVYGKDPKQKDKIEQYWIESNKEKIQNKLEDISKNPWINKNYPHIPKLLPEALSKLDKKINSTKV